MKKLMTLILAAGFILGSVCSASAVEITASGSFDFMWGWFDNADNFGTKQDTRSQVGLGDVANAPVRGTEDHFHARQRERLQVNFVASENVQGVLYFEIGETVWGNPAAIGRGSGGALGTDGVAVEVRRAYIDFNVPNTELLFRVGLQGLALPAAVIGNPILDDDGAAIVATYTINDMVSVGAFWARPFDVNNNIPRLNQDVWAAPRFSSFNDEVDLFGLYVPVTVDGMMSITPFVMYGIAGTDAFLGGGQGLGTNAQNTARATNVFAPGTTSWTDNDYQYLWWAGGAFEFTMLDPLTFALDVMWGTSIDPSQSYNTRNGWYLAGRVDYQTPYVTPGLIAWWTTGDDDNIYNGSEKMPWISGTFAPTSFGYDGTSLLSSDDALQPGGSGGPGTWGVALQFADISFIEDLTHTLRFAYIAGTNDTESMRDYVGGTRNAPLLRNPTATMLTTADHAWEINFDHKYQIYENLAAVVEMGMVALMRQAYPWRTPQNRRDSVAYDAQDVQMWLNQPAWKLALGLQYRF